MFTAVPFTATKKRRAAAYARVSADSDEQYTSYVAQVDYYTNYIQNHNDWEFAGIYTDEGITGISTRKRDGFNRMIADAIAGKIYRQIRMFSSSVGIPFCIFMRMDALGRTWTHMDALGRNWTQLDANGSILGLKNDLLKPV